MISKEKSLRGTGRTTRMLQEAERLAMEGHYVVIPCSGREKEHLQSMLTDILNKHFITNRNSSTINYSGGQINFISFGTFNFENLRAIGIDSSAKVLIDHKTIENKYSKILEMLHRFDSDSSTDN